MRVIALADCGVPLVIGSFDRIQAFLEAGLAVQPAQKEKQAYERASTDAILENVLQILVSMQSRTGRFGHLRPERMGRERLG